MPTISQIKIGENTYDLQDAQLRGMANRYTELENTIEGANSEEHIIYISQEIETISVEPPDDWVDDEQEEESSKQQVWTTHRPKYDPEYPVLFTAIQRKSVGESITCTTPRIDETLTVIDGGWIVSNSITADAINASDLHINAGNIEDSITIGSVDGLNDLFDSIQEQFTAKGEEINSIKDKTNDINNSINENIQTIKAIADGIKIEGNQIIIAGQDSSVASVFTNQSLDFISTGNFSPIASIIAEENGTGKLTITNAEIQDELQFGKWAFTNRKNGNLALKWKREIEEEIEG